MFFICDVFDWVENMFDYGVFVGNEIIQTNKV